MRASRTTNRIAVGLAVALLVTGAGCLKAIGDQTKDALGDGPTNATASEPGDDPDRADATDDEGEQLSSGATAEATYHQGIGRVASKDERVTRFSMDVTTEPVDAEDEPLDLNLLLDASKHLLVVTFRNETGPGGDGAESVSAETPERAVFAQVGRTSMFGTAAAMWTDYDETSAYPEENLSLGEPPTATGGEDGEGVDDSRNPETILGSLSEVPEGTEFTSTEITYEGEPATEVRTEFDNGTVQMDLRSVFAGSPQRPVLVEGTVHDDNREIEDWLTGEIEMRFAYGPDAEHPLEQAVTRLETTAIDREGSIGLASGQNATFVVQPSQDPGLVPLEEVEVVLSGPGSSADAPLSGSSPSARTSLPAEQGVFENETVRVAYEDADADGHVSPGDEITVEPLREDVDAPSVYLEDEVTGVHTTPAPGLAGLLLGVLSVGVFLRRRR